jgi:hypothetical protein
MPLLTCVIKKEYLGIKVWSKYIVWNFKMQNEYHRSNTASNTTSYINWYYKTVYASLLDKSEWQRFLIH